MDNVIFETIGKLAGLLLPLSALVMSLTQYLKEKWGVVDKAAEVVSLVVGFVVSALVAVSFVFPDSAQWIGIALFVVFGTIAPSGGYKLFRSLLGKE